MNKLRHVLIISLGILVGISAIFGCQLREGSSERGGFSIESSYYRESDEHLIIDVEYPVLKGFPGADAFNAETMREVEDAVKEVRDAAAEMKDREGISASLNGSYQYFKNMDIASIWMSWDNYTGGAHGLYWMDSKTINTLTGQIYSFPDLFTENSGGVEYATNKILQQISANESNFFNTASETVVAYGGDYHFLINGNELVIYFPLYDITPYVAGIQYFTFSAEDLEGLLRLEVFDAMRGQETQPIPFFPDPAYSD